MIYQEDLDLCATWTQTPLSNILRVEKEFKPLRDRHRESMRKLIVSGTPLQKERAAKRRRNSLLEKLADLATARELEEFFAHSRGALFDIGASAAELRKIYLLQAQY